MKNILTQMLKKYEIQNVEDRKHALKEVVQEVVLCGLARGKFFDSAAFYGGTALRIFHGLDRFSEDLDFSLFSPDPNFHISQFFSVLQKELGSVGLNFTAEEKKKEGDSHIQSAFLKGNTSQHILQIFGANDGLTLVPAGEKIKIKFEVDVCPPPHATFENKFALLPSPHQVKLYDMPSLFAGKIHACLHRKWGTRVKGRDFYDYVFHLSKGSKVNLKHLHARLVQSNFMEEGSALTLAQLKLMLNHRFEEIDFQKAKEDVFPFVKDKSRLDLWCQEFFVGITQNLQGCELLNKI